MTLKLSIRVNGCFSPLKTTLGFVVDFLSSRVKTSKIKKERLYANKLRA